MIKRGCKKGLSTINLVLIIIILVVIAGAVIFFVIKGAINKGGESERVDSSNLDLKISQVQKLNDSTLNLTLKRNAGEGKFVALSFVVEEGNTTEVIRINTSIQENDSESFSLNFIILNASKIDKISVTPIILGEEGEEVAGNLEDEYITPNTCSNYCPTGAQCGTNACGMKCGPGCASNYLCLNYKCIKQTTSGGGGGGGGGGSNDDEPACTDTCSSLSYQCGTRTVCGSSTNCGSCSSGYNCNTNGTCIKNTTCTDTCSSLSYQCGTPTICGNATACGNCSLTNAISTCNASYKCTISSCNSGYGNCDTNTTNGCETTLGTNSNCASCGNTCSSGYNCSTNKTCMAIPCTDNCSSLGYQCGTHTVCGSSTNCGNCSGGYYCSGNGTCMINPPSPPATGAIIANHTAVAAFDTIPSCWIEEAKQQFVIGYGHTSHGSQITTGLEMVRTAHGNLYNYSSNGAGYTLYYYEGSQYGSGDLELDAGYYPTWVTETTDFLTNPTHSNFNVIMWSWCGQAESKTEQTMISEYLSPMNTFEQNYPNVDFIYMTGHLAGSGSTGNLHLRNEQIRDYVIANNKTLFDFADIERYDPNGVDYIDLGAGVVEGDGCRYNGGSSDWCAAWCASHTCPSCGSCAHSHCFNCYNKAKAFWWMMARLAGWDGTPSDPCP